MTPSGLSGADSLAELAAALLRPSSLADLGLVALILALSWVAVRVAAHGRRGGPIWYGERGFDGVLFPLLALSLSALLRWSLHRGSLVLKIAIPVFASLALIRLAVRVLHIAYPDSPRVRLLERTLSWIAWGVLVLWITDLLPLVLVELEVYSFRLAGNEVSLRRLVEGAFSAAIVLVLSLWLSAAIEVRVMAAERIELELRKIATNAIRAGLLLIGILVAMSAVGIPIGALSVLGGALGVGIGFGLQRLAANYVSGFVILAERSLRIGDMVKVDGFEGRVTDISTRATRIRSLGGRESIVPNELLTSQRVERASASRSRLVLTTTLTIAYDTDVERLLPRLVEVVKTAPRVLGDPAPAVLLTSFLADGFELTVLFWIADPENGDLGVRSDVNRALLARLREDGIEIPYPQRVVRMLAGN